MIYLFLFINLFQQPQLTTNEYIAVNVKRGFVLVDNDSIHRWDSSNGWISSKLDANNFDVTDKLGFQLEDQIFIISRGIGEVYELLGNTVVRRDNSFNWRSRYGTLLTGYKNRIYSFGGYGLWTDKNNLIYYDQKLGEWALEDYSSLDNVPATMARGVYQHIDSINYFINPFWFSSQPTVEQKNVVAYNFNSKSWSVLGELNPALEGMLINDVITNPKQTIVINRQGLLASFDFPNNIFKKYIEHDIAVLKDARKMLYNPEIEQFLVIIQNRKENLEVPFVFSKNSLMGDAFEAIPIYLTSYKFNSFVVVSIVSLICLLIALYVFINNKRQALAEKLKANKKLIIDQLSDDEQYLFNTIIESYPDTVPLPDLIANFALQLTHESKVKKFRVSIKRIEKIIQEKFKVKEEIFFVRRNNEDKRIKEIGLNDKL